MPSSSSARITRTAISPRLATRTLENTAARISAGGRRLPTPGDCIGLLLVDLHRVGAAVGVGVQHAQAHVGPRRLDGVELEVAPVVRRRRGVPERRHGLGRVRLGADARLGQRDRLLVEAERRVPRLPAAAPEELAVRGDDAVRVAVHRQDLALARVEVRVVVTHALVAVPDDDALGVAVLLHPARGRELVSAAERAVLQHRRAVLGQVPVMERVRELAAGDLAPATEIERRRVAHGVVGGAELDVADRDALAAGRIEEGWDYAYLDVS